MGPQLIFINKSQAICGNPGDQLSWCGNLNPEVKSPICICVLSDSFFGSLACVVVTLTLPHNLLSPISQTQHNKLKALHQKLHKKFHVF